jgi:predicted restriction endonuclease
MNKLQKQKRQEEKKQDEQFARDVKDRDDWKCVICGSPIRVQTHHIIPRENRLYRHEMLNGITLCVLHHKFSLNISPHKNGFAFFLWLRINRSEQYKWLKENYKIQW